MIHLIKNNKIASNIKVHTGQQEQCFAQAETLFLLLKAHTCLNIMVSSQKIRLEPDCI
jgi:hypothetical protein